MPELGTSGSAGAGGGQPPSATRRRPSSTLVVARVETGQAVWSPVSNSGKPLDAGRYKGGPYQNTNIRTSTLSRAGLVSSCVGRRNAVCAVNRARPSVAESYTLKSRASSGVMCGNQ